jgi:hypothetical protein
LTSWRGNRLRVAKSSKAADTECGVSIQVRQASAFFSESAALWLLYATSKT